MSQETQERRRRFVGAAVKRILDVPEKAPLDETKTALGALGIDVDGTVARVKNLIMEYPRRLLDEAKGNQDAERKAFRQFQQQARGLELAALQEQVRLAIAELPPNSARQMQAYHRELSMKTGDDARSELIDLLWQLKKKD
jgi:hypothetical protein